MDNAEGKKEIQIVSDIDTVATAYYQRMSLYKALHDNDNSFMNRWGGEIQRRGYTVYINKRIGVDRGFTIREGKNLTGFEGTSNIDNLVTRAVGQGYNGILGNYIDSPLIGSYNRIYTSVIKYDDVKVKDEYSEDGYNTLEEAQTELDRRINEEFSENDVDKIKASYTINFVQLEKTEEYKNYIVAERLFIGDDCRVYIPKLNIDIKVRALSKKYDVLAQKTKEISLSNYIEIKPLSLKQIIDKLESMDSTETILQLAKDNATSLIKGGLKNSYVIVRENEIIIGDTKDINTMNKVWRWNNGGLGFSSTGYYGNFGTAITQDGAIVADFITTGILNANLIKTGIIQAMNGDSYINLDTGEAQITGELRSVNGDEWVGLNAGGLTFQDWHRQEQVLRVASANFTENRDMNGIVFAMPRYSDFIGFSHIDKENLNDGWTTSDTQYNFLEMWSSDQLVDGFQKNKGISFYARAFFNGGIRVKSASDNSYATITGTSTYNNGTGITKKLLGLYGDNGVILGYKNADSLTARLIVSEECFAGTGDTITSFGNWNFQAYTLHNVKLANYTLTNTYANTETRTIAEVSALETNSTDNIRYVYKNITSKDNKIVLNIPNEYLGRDYDIVGVAKFGFGDYAIISKEENRFIIETDREITMNIEISIA